jgi:hypothetical protein
VFPLHLPENRDERWVLLDEILDAWLPESPTASGIDAAELDAAERRLGLSLPPALREWYARHGARSDIWSLQDKLWVPAEIRVEDGVLTFAIENQGVVRWGIRLDDLLDEDPVVVVSDPSGKGGWLVESESTSGFALQFALLNAKWSGAVRHRANGQGTDEAFQAIARAYPRLPFPDMHWPAYPTRVYGHDDVLIEAEAETWLWVTGRTRRALDEVDALVRGTGMAWEDLATE